MVHPARHVQSKIDWKNQKEKALTGVCKKSIIEKEKVKLVVFVDLES